MTPKEVFRKFVPESSVNYCAKLYAKLGFEFKITKARQTKLGDYRFNPKTDKHTITVNNDLNPYSFLVTYLHEVGHLIAFKKYGRKILPHGKEWKQSFREVAKPMLSEAVFHDSVLIVLKKYFTNPAASSCADPFLYQVLKKFDKDSGKIPLKDSPIGQLFTFNQRSFIRLEKKRTRSVCQEIHSKRKYLINDLADVTVIASSPQ